MLKRKKILLALGAIAATSSIVVTTIACSKNSNEPITQIKLKDNKELSTSLKDKKIAELGKIVLITDHGSIDDKSFNQSSWEAVKAVAKQVSEVSGEQEVEKTIKSLVPQGGTTSDFEAQYDVALNQGYKYWILPGFAHSSKIKPYWKKNETRLKEAGIIIIGVDFDPSIPEGYFGEEAESEEAKNLRMQNLVSKENSIGLLFKTQEAGFIVGFGAAKYLGENSENKKIHTFGGAENPGVTNFNRGFLAGIKVYNDETTDKTKRVEITGNEITLNSGFNDESATMIGAASAAVNSGAKIILPVAGPATGVVLDNIGKKDIFVIGVDVDESKVKSKSAIKFFSSIEKRMAQAVYDSLIGLYTKTNMPSSTKAIVEEKGVSDDWVGYAPSTIADKDKANAALKFADEFYKNEANKSKIDDAMQTDENFNKSIQTNLNKLAEDINKKFKEASATTAAAK